MTDIENLSLDDLTALQSRIDAEIDARRRTDTAKAQEEILAMASRYGLDVRFTEGKKARGPGKGSKRGIALTKYRHPTIPSKVWSGRGRSPTWVTEWKIKHGTLEALLVK